MKRDKVIMIVLDGLKYQVAIDELGFIGNYVEKGIAARYKVISELPSLSKPLYEVLLTGLPVNEHGITHNKKMKMSENENIFSLVRKNNMTNATASYYWISELYNHLPFDKQKDRIQLATNKTIENGIFYYKDNYPDSHVIDDANFLLDYTNPDFLYIHTMNIDDNGHKHGSDSLEYHARALAVDSYLADYLPKWLSEGYQIVITSDHGMDFRGNHGGTTEDVRAAPLYVFSNKVISEVYEQPISQLMIAPLICHLLGIEPSDKMQKLKMEGV